MAAHQAPPSLGFSRQEHWSGLPSPPEISANKWSKCGETARPRDQILLCVLSSLQGSANICLPKACFHLHVNCPSLKSHSTSLSIFFCLSWRWHFKAKVWASLAVYSIFLRLPHILLFRHSVASQSSPCSGSAGSQSLVHQGIIDLMSISNKRT